MYKSKIILGTLEDVASFLDSEYIKPNNVIFIRLLNEPLVGYEILYYV